MFMCGGCAWLKTVKTKYQYACGALQCASMLLAHTERERANVILIMWESISGCVHRDLGGLLVCQVLRQCGL